MSHETPAPPKLADLLARYLDKQADAAALGAVGRADPVTPYEAGPVQPVDPKLAWDEAREVLGCYAGADAKPGKAPPQWASLVAGQEPTLALAFAAGNFPPMVRDFHLVLQHGDLTALRPQPGRPIEAPELTAWSAETAKAGSFPQTLLALGTLRLAKLFDAAERLVRDHASGVPAEWRGGCDNERAALAWHAGRSAEARALWQQLDGTVPVLFNRGMADLFLGDPTAARTSLDAAIAAIPERSAWHHLGRLYRALAEPRG
jgi:hypothetical protein